MICPGDTWTGFQTGVAVGFALGAAFVILLCLIYDNGRNDK